MRFLSINRVLPGDKLAKPVYSQSGTILLRENYILTRAMIDKLINLGYVGMYIEDEISKDIEIEEIVSEKLRVETAARLEEIMNTNCNVIELMPSIGDIVESIIVNRDVISNMNRILGHHDYTYIHCVNVSIYAVILGIKLGLSRKELVELGTAGMLHDIGKKFIPVEILDKPGRLTKDEFDIIRSHPRLGYETIKDCREISSTVKTAVLQHHERYDGTGYPGALVGKKISKFARILAIVDTYDAMISDRAYHKALPPYEAVEFLMGNGNRLFDGHYVQKFLQCIAAYPVGTCVKLSNDKEAIVVKNYADSTLRPLIRLLDTQKLLDLKYDVESLSICITSIIE